MWGLPVPALSRVNPLPQVLHSPQDLRGPCGSGFTREEARAGNLIARPWHISLLPPAQPLL
ncbi:hypothetical protein CMV24_01275 [Pseudomonas plecoglossicida]|uniref:Uncharacterized protein n=2 Tax=Pseudomonas putida group TaxID=136845 RepID=A0A2A3MB77_PSEDL|nr:hypothetical protein CMV24_01275 [Pseudomonas plecoglossicida]RNF87567.1 hypothetical protein EFK07_15730 [Pseudomonas putida]